MEMSSSSSSSASAGGQPPTGDLKLVGICHCGIPACPTIRAEALRRGENSHLLYYFVHDSVTGIVVSDCLGINQDKRYSRLSIAGWHFRDGAFTADGKFKIRCEQNPEINCQGNLYLVSRYESILKNRHGFQRIPGAGGSGDYYSAPTVTLAEYQQAVAARANQHGSGRKSQRAMSTTAAREEEQVKRARLEIEALSPEAKHVLDNDRADLERKLCENSQRIRELEEENVQVKSKFQDLLDKQAILAADRQNLDIGNIDSREFWTSKGNEAVSRTFGFPDFDRVEAFARKACVLFKEKGMEPSDEEKNCPGFNELRELVGKLVLEAAPSADRVSHQKYVPENVSPIAQVLVTLLFLRTGLTYDEMELFLGLSRSVVGRIVQKILPRLSVMGKLLTALPCDDKIAGFLAPDEYHSDPSKSIYGMIDGSDFPCHTIRIDSAVSRMTYSSKLSGAAMRVMALVAPCGLILAATPAVLGRGTEMDVCSYFREWFKDICVGWQVLADRGFDGLSVYLPNKNEVLLPHFKNPDQRQFSPRQLDESQMNAIKRYVVEVLFSRVKRNCAIAGIIPREHFQNFDNMWFASAGLTIMMAPLRQPHGHVKYETLADAYFVALQATRNESQPQGSGEGPEV
jgi:hypothetical protein